MTLSPGEIVLLRVSKAVGRDFRAFDEAVHLTSTTGRTVDDLREQACADRLRLATHFVATGDKLLGLGPSQSRSAVSRFYYGMYHAMRAVVYFMERGDDHQEHSTLPKKTPPDFVNSALWENNLKDARGRRNEADYDPYPISLSPFRTTALQLQANAHELVRLSRTYLQGKGCRYV